MFRIKYFTLGQFEQEEKWLESMAKQGWRIRREVPFVIFFEKSAPADLVYRYDFETNARKAKEMINLYEEYGWHYVCQCNSFLLFEKKDDGRHMDLFANRTEMLEMIARITKKRMIPAFLMFGILGILLILNLILWNAGQRDLTSLLISAGCFTAVGIICAMTAAQLKQVQSRYR